MEDVLSNTENEYLMLYIEEDAIFLKNYLGLLKKGSVKPGLIQTQHNNLVRLLLKQPYPTLQLLDINFELCRYNFTKSISAALKIYIAEHDKEFSSNFLSFLANFPDCVLEASSLRRALLELLVKCPFDRYLGLALISRKTNYLIEALLSFWKQLPVTDEELLSREYIAYQVIELEQHFLPAIINGLSDISIISDGNVRNIFVLLKLFDTFSVENKKLSELKYTNELFNLFKIKDSNPELREKHKIVYNEFQRYAEIMRFVQSYPNAFTTLQLGEIKQIKSILQLIHKYGLQASFDDVFKTMDTIYKLQNQNQPFITDLHEKELEILIHYSILDIVVGLVFPNNSGSSNQRTNIEQTTNLTKLLRKIKKTECICNVIANIFKILLFRWEDSEPVSKNQPRAKRSTSNKMQLSSSTDFVESEVVLEYRQSRFHKTPDKSSRHGFVCQGPTFHNILQLLKKFMTKTLHSQLYKTAENSIQDKFQLIMATINEFLWKDAIIKRMGKSSKDFHVPYEFLPEEEIHKLIHFHENSVPINTSDEDNSELYDSFVRSARRKSVRKTRHSTCSGDTVNVKYQSKEKKNHQNNTDDSVQNHHLHDKNKTNSSYSLTSIIPKLLATPENLLNMAIANNNYDEAKCIVEHFSLQNNDVAEEVRFDTEQKIVKKKLALIYENYSKLNISKQNTQEPVPTVEQIKSVAAKGFEVSKIISVVDNFARTHPIKQNPKLKELLAKLANNRYTFLHLFESHNLNAFVITDLILDLPFNREITSNIIKVIKRQQQMSADIASTTPNDGIQHKEKFSLPSEIGPMALLENLCECLRLIEQTSDHQMKPITLRDLLCDNFYSLKPKKLSEELHRKQSFEALFFKTESEIASCKNLREYGGLIQNLTSKYNFYGRFVNYIGYLNKIMKMRDPNLELHTSELLKNDPYCIIGDLIFECNVTPTELEKDAVALNLNLAHVVALNMCPEISDKPILKKARVIPEGKYDIIYSYLNDHSPLLAYLLKCINQPSYIHENQTIDLIYLKRYLELPECQKLSKLYGGNLLVAALRSDFVKLDEIERIESKMEQLDIYFTYIGNEEFRKSRSKKIDKIVHDLIEEDSKNIILAKHITNISVRAQLIKDYYMKIPTSELAEELIELTLSHKLAPEQISLELRENLQQTLSNIKVYAEVSRVLQLNTWTQAYDFGLKSPNDIFEKLLQLQSYELCYNWSQAIDLQKYFNQSKRLLLNTLLDILLRLNDNGENYFLNTFLIKIIESFPFESRIEFFDENKDNFHSIAVLEYAIDFLKQNSRKKYRNYLASLKILKSLELSERTQFWTLVKFPLLIVEQLIMNARFEKLARVLKAIREHIEADSDVQRCSFCYDKSGNVYDIHSKSNAENLRFQLGTDSSHSAFILLNFNLYQIDHTITNECIDLLLRIYATKALDYYVSARLDSSSEINSQGSEMQSLDSLCGTFQMPKQAPTRDDWVRDEDASHCMCCRRARFTMLMRRHHCRRCGRVVCYACSMYRAFIPELYAELPVRVCKDCQESLEKLNNKLVDNSIPAEFDSPEFADSFLHYKDINNYKWELSGNITHDKLLREEFGYDHAPSVALCLSILEYHFDQQKCVDLLLYHCRKLEKLIIPNPEVDYELVAKMMNCLALAAKVRGAPAEVETIREHSEIIIAVVHNGCADLIPPGPFNNNSLRKLADSLVKAEHWKLALEVHLKCGFPTAGVMAAHGLACLRAGAYDTARERFSHCMNKTSNNYINSNITKYIFSNNKIKRDKNEEDISKIYDIPQIKRANRGPPLLKEILSVLKSIPIRKPPPETLQRASLVRTSNTSLASLFTRRKEQYSVPQHEPALNILTRLANLKNITNGQYSEAGLRHMHVPEYTESEKEKNRQTRNFEESMHYVLTYGSHADILSFLMDHYELNASLRYYLFQSLDAEYFINNIYLKLLPRCQIPDLIKKMQDINDESLGIWRNTLLQTCRYLQKNKLLNSLYHLQILVNDPVRASMTCVKFYSMNCINFRQLHANSEHLHNARTHLQAELEKSEWDNIKFEGSILSGLRKKSFGESSRRASVSSTSTQSGAITIPMQLDARSLNTHINTILLQLEVAKFLAKCEAENSLDTEVVTEKILKQMRIESDKTALPTLFESIQDKIQLCVLIIFCGKNIDEGFGLAYRIIQDYKIMPIRVYAATGKYLAQNHRLHDVEKLINCITGNNETCTSDIDEVLSVSIHSAVNTHEPVVKSTLDNLVKRIEDVQLRISAHIFIGQLKSAYLLANKYDRLGDIRKILRQAELLNQIHIKKLCEKKLNIDTTSGKS